MEITYAGAGSEKALTVMPKNELAVIAKKAGDRADTFHKIGKICGIGALSGFGVAVGVPAAAAFAPAIAPIAIIVAIAGLISFLGGGAACAALENVEYKERTRRDKAIAERAERLYETARIALDGAIKDGTIRVGPDLRIAPKDETLKKLHVEDVTTFINSSGDKELNVSAKILEADGTGIDWLKGDSSAVSLRQSIAAFPPALKFPPQPRWHPEPPTVRKPEKKLPRIKLG